MRANRKPRPPRRPALMVLVAILLLPLLPNAIVTAGEPERIGDDADPVLAAIAINQARGAATPAPTPPRSAVLGRDDVFADNLAATSLALDSPLLFTEGGPTALLRDETLAELSRLLDPTACEEGEGATVFLAGGVNALSQAVEDELLAAGFCVERLAGPSRVETAVAVADRLPEPSGTVLLARSDEYADAASIGPYAALTRSRILVTPTDGLHPAVSEALERMAPDQIVLLGGTAALSETVEQQAASFAPVTRVAGPTRDTTATAIAEELWTSSGPAARSGAIVLADGYDELDWTYLFAAAGFAADARAPMLYTLDGDQPPGTREYVGQNPPSEVTVVGPAPLADVPLSEVRIGLETVISVDQPLMIKPRPGTADLWIIERRGSIQALGPEGVREVLDISGTVSTNGERGLLGLAFSPDGSRLYTSSTDGGGDSVLDEFQITDGVADVSTRRRIIEVDQPASNHNGGDLVWGPDDHLYWALGDGGASDDLFGNGQNTGSLLGGIVRLDVTGAQPYAVPPDNPFVGGGGAPELWAYGLRNPWRIAFDPQTDDLYIGDVGQNRVEEIDFVPAGTGGGRNYGWPVFEGSRPFAGSSLADHTPPILDEPHAQGNCSITGGVVYRGTDIPELDGVYLYSDLCRSSIRGLVVGDDGTVVEQADFEVRVTGGSPVGFGVDHSGEVLVVSLNGSIDKIVPGP